MFLQQWKDGSLVIQHPTMGTYQYQTPLNHNRQTTRGYLSAFTRSIGQAILLRQHSLCRDFPTHDAAAGVISTTTGQWSDAPYISLRISHILTRSAIRSLRTTAQVNGISFDDRMFCCVYLHMSSRHPMPFARQLNRYEK